MLSELETLLPNCKIDYLSPFGLCIHSDTSNQHINSLPIDLLKQIILKHRLILLRGFSSIVSMDLFSQSTERWGKLLEWDFGTVLEVEEHKSPINYIFTSGSVPYHWDGAFADTVPWLQFFQCRYAQENSIGGETIFCDTSKLYNGSPEKQKLWDRINIDYSSQKVAHYGGKISNLLVDNHPKTSEKVIRFAEPANINTVPLNTPYLKINGIELNEVDDFLSDIRVRLYDPEFVYQHQWMQNDFLIADNHVLLHARTAYESQNKRCLWRVHIL